MTKGKGNEGAFVRGFGSLRTGIVTAKGSESYPPQDLTADFADVRR